jgi:predicted secreted protein
LHRTNRLKDIMKKTAISNSNTSTEEMIERFLDKVEKISKKLGLTLYYDKEYVVPVPDGGIKGKCREITTREELKDVFYDDTRFICLGEDFTKQVYMSCIKDKKLKEFFYKNTYLPGTMYINTFVELLKEQKSSPGDMLELISRSANHIAFNEPEMMEPFISELINHYPSPENRQALAIYLLKQKEAGIFDQSWHHNNAIISKEQFQDMLLQVLKQYLSNEELQDFIFIAPVKNYLQAQKNHELFKAVPVEKTLILNFSYQELTDYMSIPDFLVTDARPWMNHIKESLEEHGKADGIQSVDILSSSETCKMYVNLSHQNVINEQGFHNELHNLIEYLIQRSNKPTIYQDTEGYLKTYWLRQKLEKDCNLHDNEESPAKIKI